VRGMSRIYLSYDPEQRLLLPPDLREWLPEGHLALFISDVVDELDLSAIWRHYESGDGRGRPPYHPLMMVKLLVYGYRIGKVSSRKLHLPELAGLFVQVLKMCERAGLVKLGHVAIDGSKMRANASKHKAMSYEADGRERAAVGGGSGALIEGGGGNRCGGG
jgi:transposase